jgi:hypothetical protein
MLVTDRALHGWLAGVGVTFGEAGRPLIAGGLPLDLVCGAIGAVIVVAAGSWLAHRKGRETPIEAEAEQPKS